MKNVFGKIECPSCHQYKIQPAIPVLYFLGLIFVFIPSFIIPFTHLTIDSSIKMAMNILGILFFSIYIIQLLTHKTGYFCKNCGKIYSYDELRNLAKQQNIELQDATKKLVLLGIVFSTVVIGIVFYFAFRTGFQNVPKGNAHWDKAQALFQQIKNEKDPQKMVKIDADIITELKTVLVEQPNNPRVWSELGNAYGWVGTIDGASEAQLAAYQKAESLDLNNIVYINSVGDQLVSMGKFNEGILELQKAVRVGPNDNTYLSLAEAYRGAKIYDSAKQNYQKAIDGFTSHNSDGTYDTQILQAQQEMAALPKN